MGKGDYEHMGKRGYEVYSTSLWGLDVASMGGKGAVDWDDCRLESLDGEPFVWFQWEGKLENIELINSSSRRVSNRVIPPSESRRRNLSRGTCHTYHHHMLIVCIAWLLALFDSFVLLDIINSTVTIINDHYYITAVLLLLLSLLSIYSLLSRLCIISSWGGAPLQHLGVGAELHLGARGRARYYTILYYTILYYTIL